MKHLLDKIPELYRMYTGLIGMDRVRSVFIREYVRPKDGDRILDIGCGTGDILKYMPDVDYYGFDANPQYIKAAKKHFGNRGIFACEKVGKKIVTKTHFFDIVLASAVLHHLDDKEASHLFELARVHLKKGGRLLTYDACKIKGQTLLTRLLYSMDRGRYIRRREDYEKLAKGVFSKVKCNIRHDLLRVPFTHIIMECYSP